MRIQILGTAAAEGWPGLFCSCDACERARVAGGKNLRSRSATIIDGKLMIDFSADTYSNSIRQGLSLSSIQALFITHDHEDHFCPSEFHYRYGDFAHISKNDPVILTVYGNDRVGDKLAVYMNKAATKPQRLAFQLLHPFDCISTSGYHITPLPALHDPHQHCYIFLIEDTAGKRMLYGHDTGVFPNETLDALKRKHLDLIMFDCNAGPRRDGKNHMGFADNLIVYNLLKDAGCTDHTTKLILTHFSHNCRLLHEELEAMAHHEGFLVAYDGVIYNV